MTCEPARDLVEPYLDDELDAALAAQVREHLLSCKACGARHAQLLELRSGILAQAPYYRAPADLRQRIRAGLRQAEEPAFGRWRWIAIAASLLLAVSLAWNIALFRKGTIPIAEMIVDSHIRSLMGTHVLDVPSSDQHTVKPWFNGKLNFSPDTKNLSSQGFPLIGGRLDYVDGRPVAVLVYQRRQHVINLFTWPANGSGGEGEVTRNGYHMLHWNSAGMTYWAVSDLSPMELRRFENLYKEP